MTGTGAQQESTHICERKLTDTGAATGNADPEQPGVLGRDAGAGPRQVKMGEVSVVSRGQDVPVSRCREGTSSRRASGLNQGSYFRVALNQLPLHSTSLPLPPAQAPPLGPMGPSFSAQAWATLQ